MEKEEVVSIIDFLEQELSKIGRVVKNEIFTDRGIDIECFSNSRLRLSLDQLVDSQSSLLPVLKTQLDVNNVVEISRNNNLVYANTNVWTLYLNREEETTLSALRKSVPQLLQLFLADFVKANGADKKPTFFVTYDASWW